MFRVGELSRSCSVEAPPRLVRRSTIATPGFSATELDGLCVGIWCVYARYGTAFVPSFLHAIFRLPHLPVLSMSSLVSFFFSTGMLSELQVCFVLLLVASSIA